jgi:hypothetical protein
LFCSLAFLPVIAFAAGWCAVDVIKSPRLLVNRHGAALLSAMVGFAAPIVALRVAAGLDLPGVWWLNYHNHAGFYAQFTRTYTLWLVANPLELTFAVGWPLMAAALAMAWRWLKPGRPGFVDRRRALLVGLAVWVLLWLSGKNSGEAARLWLLLMPGVVWLAAHFAEPDSTSDSAGVRLALGWRLALLALSLVVCALTVHRVGGFQLE